MPITEATGTVLAGLASSGAYALNNGLNMLLTSRMNKRQEELMRESWAREDNAVQRRVADLKAAGLSPTLAAGSAAASSGPINLQTPKADFGGVVDRFLEAKSAMNALKAQEVSLANAKKQGELLDLQKEYYGYPDWAVAGIRMFGLEGFKDMVRQVGGNLFGLFQDSSSYPGSDPLSIYPKGIQGVGAVESKFVGILSKSTKDFTTNFDGARLKSVMDASVNEIMRLGYGWRESATMVNSWVKKYFKNYPDIDYYLYITKEKVDNGSGSSYSGGGQGGGGGYAGSSGVPRGNGGGSVW